MRERSTRPDRKYAAIPNHVLRDQVVSMEARGLLALLMTYSDEWQFVKEHLLSITGWGRDKFERVMGELISNGYVERTITRDESGRLTGSSWVIRDDPTDALKIRASVSTDALKNRPPVKPTPGESAPKNTYREEDQSQESLFGSIEPHNVRETEGKEPSASKQIPTVDLDEAFERFWKSYPKRTEKKAARAKFIASIRREKINPNRLIAAAAAYAQTDAVKRGYAKNPTTWLNGGCWDDEGLNIGPATSNPEAKRLMDEAAIERRLGNWDAAQALEARARAIGGGA